MQNKKTKAVVTGGAGFIGSNLTDALLEKGFEVHVVDDLSNGKKENLNPKAVFHNVDIRKVEDLRPIVKGADYVFHEAALPRVQFSIENPILTDEVNVGGTRNLLVASAEAGVKKFIYAASSSAYGEQENMPKTGSQSEPVRPTDSSRFRPLREDMTPNPLSPYGLQKYAGEVYCKVWSSVYKLPTVSLRYFNVYGPRNSAEGAYALVIAKFFALRKEGKPMTITSDGEQTRDFTSVHDVVRANLLAMESENVGKGEVINIGCGRNQSVNKIAELIGGPVEYIPARLEPRDTLADNSLAKKLLGWEPKVSIEDGIEELKRVA